jgi:hypothetical protein
MEPADGQLSGKVGNLESCVSILKPPSNDLRGRGGAAEALIAMPKRCYFLAHRGRACRNLQRRRATRPGNFLYAQKADLCDVDQIQAP